MPNKKITKQEKIELLQVQNLRAKGLTFAQISELSGIDKQKVIHYITDTKYNK